MFLHQTAERCECVVSLGRHQARYTAVAVRHFLTTPVCTYTAPPTIHELRIVNTLKIHCFLSSFDKTNYTVSQKRDPDIIDCNFKKD